MERKLYLEKCRQVSVLEEGVMRTKKNVPFRLLVSYKGKNYYPESFVMWFDAKGNVMNTGIVHDLKTTGTIHVLLEQLEEPVEKEEREQ